MAKSQSSIKANPKLDHQYFHCFAWNIDEETNSQWLNSMREQV